MTATTVGPFTVVAELGSGRLGPLQLGRHGTTGELVCLRQLDAALLARAETRDAIIRAVRRVAAGEIPGVVRVIDLLQSGDRWYLVTARVPGPALRDLLDRSQLVRLRGFRGDAGLAGVILGDVGRACLALHGVGVAHGSLGPASVLCSVEGAARLVDPALLAIATGTAVDPATDARSWADLARVLRAAWVPARDGSNLDRAAERAEAGDLRGAVEIFDADERQVRARLAAVASAWEASPALPAADTPPLAVAGSSQRPTMLDIPGAASVAEVGPATVIEPPPPAPTASRPSTETVIERVPPVPAATVPVGGPAYRLGSPPPPSADAQRAPAAGGIHVGSTPGGGAGSGSLLVGDLPGHSGLEPAWPAAPVRRRPSRSPLLLGAGAALAVIVVGGVILATILRHGQPLQATAAQVQIASPQVGCDSTVDIVGVIGLNGQAGTVDYSWQRNDSASTGGVQHQPVASGQTQLVVHLAWSLSGPGRFQGVATLNVSGPTVLAPAQGTFRYVC
jgi:hypothetical protein